MNTYKAILDTSRSNGVIATITQFDNATLELQIVTNGEIEHAWESPQFELVAIKRDQYAVRESDQAAFTIKDAGEHLVSVDLKEQFLTCRGSTKMQLVVKDGDRLTTSVFYVMIGESLDHTIIESHRDVAVLDDLEAYIQTGREVIYDAQAIVTDLKDEMSEFNTSSSEKEAERQASELNRASKELVRIDNEETRVANEHDRVTNEEDRVTNEEERVANEHDRVTNEQNRRLAENTRIAQERARQDAELQRNSIFEENETIRKDGEKKRITNENEREKKFSTWEERETTRLRSEENRIIQEQVRVANEETRQRQEQTRQNQEDYRQRTYTQFNEAEANRVAKELQRQTAEEKRVVAETNRQNSYADRENERDRQYAESENTRNDAFNQNEANRQSEYTTAERERVESEELRKSRERERETAESQRVTTERERVNAEQKRIADFNREIKKSQDAMNQAASNVSGAIDTANSTMESIEQRAEACLPVIEQSSNEIERARVDYIGNQHSSIKKANDANVDWLLGEVNTTHYEGQHITATDTIEGQSKSAILSGNTLVNILNYNNVNLSPNNTINEDGVITISGNGGWSNAWIRFRYAKPNTQYLMRIHVIENTLVDSNLTVNAGNEGEIFEFKVGCIIEPGQTGIFNFILTSKNDISNAIYGFRGYCSSSLTSGYIRFKVAVIEYQQDMENWDIPYFYGMSSVKLPVLTTTGKNLYSYGDLTINNPITDRWFYTNGRTSSFGSSCKRTDGGNWFYLEEGVYSYKSINENTRTNIGLTGEGEKSYGSGQKIPSGWYVFRFKTKQEPVDYVKISQIQIEQGTTATTYEPYKSNILSTSEDVELRGIGDVKDELNCLTGEVVERIGELVLDGSQTYMIPTGEEFNTVQRFRTTIPNIKNVNVICDKLPTKTTSLGDDERLFVASVGENGSLYFNLLKTKATNIDELKTYLSQNPITIQYQLITESIKTVDVSDNHVYSYKDVTHYDCSSAEGSLVPTLSVDVPTNLSALVSRQRATIETLESENQALKLGQADLELGHEHQEEEIISTQDAVNFLLFDVLNAASYRVGQKEYDRMAVYIANQIIRGKVSYQLAVSKYPQFLNDIDEILVNEGRGDLIVKID